VDPTLLVIDRSDPACSDGMVPLRHFVLDVRGTEVSTVSRVVHPITKTRLNSLLALLDSLVASSDFFCSSALHSKCPPRKKLRRVVHCTFEGISSHFVAAVSKKLMARSLVSGLGGLTQGPEMVGGGLVAESEALLSCRRPLRSRWTTRPRQDPW